MNNVPATARRFASADEVLGQLEPLRLPPNVTLIVSRHGADLIAAVRGLAAEGLVDEAVGVLAQALERRAAAWWACTAARREPAASDPGAVPSPAPSGPGASSGGNAAAEARAIEAAETWVRKPDAVNADAARAAAEAADAASPAACAALAAFLAGESLAPPGGTAVPPAPHLAGIAAAGAVRLTAVRRRPEVAGKTLRDLLDVGLAIAAGRESWSTSGTESGA